MTVIGIDIGSVAAKAYIISNGSHHRAMIPTGWSPREAGQALIDQLLDKSGLERDRVERIYCEKITTARKLF